jgi:hypothetical protein
MKIIIRDNKIFAVHGDEQFIEDKYVGMVIRIVPDSYSVKLGDPDPYLSLDQATQDIYMKRITDINTILPSWSQVLNRIDAISNLADAKVVLKNIAKIVYWLVKNRDI